MTGSIAHDAPSTALRVLAGPPPGAGPERHVDHLARLGALPPARDLRDVIPVLEASGLLGRGGAAFPVGRKWRAVAERSAGDAVVVVNGAEGEPRSAKDRALMEHRPHLVLDGALAAASAVGAREIVLYVGSEHVAAQRALAQAVGEREREIGVHVRLVTPPVSYVAGEATAAIHCIDRGDARPTFPDVRPHERGVGGRPTLVQNAESLAHAALIARFGDAWYRTAGRGPTRGTALVTVTGLGGRMAVREIEYGTTVAEVAGLVGAALAGTSVRGARSRGANPGGSMRARAGLAPGLGAVPRAGEDRGPGAVLLGGYFGGWAALDDVRDAPLDPAVLREHDLAFGCGVLSFAGAGTCGVRATAEIMGYMAAESAAQCGPCVFGLAAIAEALRRLAQGTAGDGELDRIEHWAGLVEGRGACHHPDGAIGLLRTALPVFEAEFARHQARQGCSALPVKAA